LFIVRIQQLFRESILKISAPKKRGKIPFYNGKAIANSNIIATRQELAQNKSHHHIHDEVFGYPGRNWHGHTAAIITMRREAQSPFAAFGGYGEETRSQQDTRVAPSCGIRGEVGEARIMRVSVGCGLGRCYTGIVECWMGHES
jgi:hypothetical protein